MKRTLCQVCTLILLIGLLASVASVNAFAEESTPAPTPWDGKTTATGFADGDGSFGNPYIISTPEEFNYLAQFVRRNGISVKKYFVLTNDLDFGGNTIVSVGTQNAQFKGIFDGRGHTISNFKMNTTTEGDYLALFANINGSEAAVKNFTVSNATYTGSGKIYVGAIAAFLSNGVISNIKLESTVKIELTGESNGSTGGVAARNYGLIQYVVSEATVNVNNTKEKTQNFVGGIAGATGKGTGVIRDCIVRGKVETTLAYAGGISGIMGVTTEGQLQNCYNYAKVTSTYAAGGITGRFHVKDCTLDQCYNLSDNISGPANKTGSVIGDLLNPGTVKGCQSVTVTGFGYFGTGFNTDVDTTAFELSATTLDEIAQKVTALEAAIAANAAEEAKIVYEEEETTVIFDDTDFTDFPEDSTAAETKQKSDNGIGTKPSGNGKTDKTSTEEKPAEETEGCQSAVGISGGICLLLAAFGCAVLPKKQNRKGETK